MAFVDKIVDSLREDDLQAPGLEGIHCAVEFSMVRNEAFGEIRFCLEDLSHPRFHGSMLQTGEGGVNLSTELLFF